MKSQISSLKLVYPPISNQEAVWLERDAGVVERLRRSDFYMIVGRAEAKLAITEVYEELGVVEFDFKLMDGRCERGAMRLLDMPGAADAPSLVLEEGEKIFRIWDRPREQEGARLLEWFTTEKLLYDRSHGHSAIDGLDGHWELSTYDLFYVGIAKKGDSFDRLLKHGHKKRMDILANELLRHPGSRVSDETYLLLFEIETLGIQTFSSSDGFEEIGVDFTSDRKRIVADAEKAFVKLLDPQYNEAKFPNYPKGSDGLYGTGLTRYGYVLDENIVLNAGGKTIKGAHSPVAGLSSKADAIFIEGDVVRHFVAGVNHGD